MQKSPFSSSVKNAIRGLLLALQSERNFKWQILGLLLNLLLIVLLKLSSSDAAIILLCCGVVLASELLNTAIEKLCDYIEPEWKNAIGQIKDVSAGAVLLITLVCIFVAILIYYPYVANFL